MMKPVLTATATATTVLLLLLLLPTSPTSAMDATLLAVRTLTSAVERVGEDVAGVAERAKVRNDLLRRLIQVGPSER